MKKIKPINLLFVCLFIFGISSCYSGGRDNCIKGMMKDGMTYDEAADACDDFHTNANNRE